MMVNTYRLVLAVAAIFAFFTELVAYLNGRGLFPLGPNNMALVFSLLALPLLLQRPIRITPLMSWSLLFAMVSMVWFISFPQSDVSWIELKHRTGSVFLLLSTLIILSEAAAQRIARIAMVISVIIAVALNLYEVFNPLTFSGITGRSAGWYLHPNKAAAALVLGMILGQGVVKPRYRLLFMLVVGLGVLTTFSRAGLLGWLIVVGLASIVNGQRLRSMMGMGLAGVVLVGFVFSPWWGNLQRQLTDEGVINRDTLNRVAFFETGAAADASAVERAKVADMAWDAVQAHPLAGAGLGAYARPPFDQIGPHNMYLSLMIDHGFLLGFLILPLLTLATVWGASGETRATAVQFAVFVTLWPFFSHNMLTEKFLMLPFALLSAMVIASRDDAPVRWRLQYEDPSRHYGPGARRGRAHAAPAPFPDGSFPT